MIRLLVLVAVLGLALAACANDPATAAPPPAPIPGGSTAFLDSYLDWLDGGPLPATDVPAPKDLHDLMLGGN